MTCMIDLYVFNLSDYTLISDPARINSFGGLATYVHTSFSFKRISIEELNQNSTVYDSMFIEIYRNQNGIKKYIIGNIYRRPSEIVEDITSFISDFTEAISYVKAMSKKVYIAGDFNINLLKINRHNYYNIFYENII